MKLTEGQVICVKIKREIKHCPICPVIPVGPTFAEVCLDTFDCPTYAKVDVNGKDGFIDLTDNTAFEYAGFDTKLGSNTCVKS